MTSALLQQFIERFGPGDEPLALRAPGRVNLIGEHTDYNDGFVLPIAIEREIAAMVRRRGDRRVRLASTTLSDAAEIDLDAPATPGEPAWANYCRGVFAGLQSAGIEPAGCEILFDSSIPHGAGLSSSAALEVATALAACAAAGIAPPAGMDLARLCQRAEHDFAGTPCGIMDQAIVVLGRRDSALLLDCRDGAVRHIPFGGPDLTLLVCDTQVKHELNDGGYALRRRQCEQAAEALGVASLRGAFEKGAALSDTLEGDLLRRARHVVGEIARTVEAAEVLGRGDVKRFGELMVASHASLRDDYNVSCEELDAVVEAALAQDGVFGARMTGGGFGGSAIVLCDAAAAKTISAAIVKAFVKKYGREIPVFATKAADGAEVLP